MPARSVGGGAQHHLIDGLDVFVPAFPVAVVLCSDLVLFVFGVLTSLEAGELLLGRYVQPELGDVVEDRSAESPFEVAATALLPEEIQRLLAPLDEREREILKLRFGLDRGEPRTLEEVGDHFNLTRERIRQIEARAMSKLRHPSSDTGARDLLAV